MTGWIALIIYVVAVWYLARLLEPEGGVGLWTLRILLWVIGLLAAGLIYWFKSRSAQAGAAVATVDEIDETIAAAEARLAASRLAAGASLKKLPIVVVLGPESSTKTTVMVQSGLEPDLLAGDVFRGKEIQPTKGVNLWFSQGKVFLEAGGVVCSQPSRWSRVVRHIRPERIGPVLFGRPQAPRVALVCFSCEEFLKPGSSEAALTAAQGLRTSLSQLSQTLGIRLPVYVLFTKTDTIPYFTDYVRNFGHNEVGEVLGTTLHVPVADAQGSYADREYRRLTDSMQRMFRTLAEKRLHVLPRETRADQRGGAYEFPREFRKISDLAVRFLVELCRPSQLAVSPFLRGFYFTGVRPVIVSDPGHEAVPQPSRPSSSSGPVVATQVFESGHDPAPTVPAPSASPTSRKVPQWVFLQRLFRDVVLKDRIALGITEHGTRINALRRWGLTAVAALFAVLALALMISFVNNRRLQTATLEAARELRGVVSTEPDLPDYETLAALDGLREQVERLGEYERHGNPWSLNWGLYKGSAMYPSARRIYLATFGDLILDPARDRIVDSLRRLPNASIERAYEPGYDLLKTYLMTTTHADRIDSAFVAQSLPPYWLANRPIDGDRMGLAMRQFEFYGGALCQDQDAAQEHPCGSEANVSVVERAQTFLTQFNATDRVYLLLLSEASEKNQSVQFNRDVPGSENVLTNNYLVPGAFTEGGWAFVHDRLDRGEEGVAVEDWVLGGQAMTEEDHRRLLRTLQTQYETDYLRHWRSYLGAASVVRYANLDDSAEKLRELAGNRSPLLQMLAVASQHTAVDSLWLGKAFQSVHYLVPPGVTERFSNESNQPYLEKLVQLQLKVGLAASASAEDHNSAVAQATQDFNTARAAVELVSQNFNISDPAGQVSSTVQSLMLQPIERVAPHLTTRDLLAERRGRVNGAGRRFCASFQSLMAKYPFNPNSRTQASLQEVTDMFQPGSGQLSRLHDEWLQGIVDFRGSRYVSAGGELLPTADFLAFFNRANAVSSTLWEGASEMPTLDFGLRLRASDAVPSAAFNIDGQIGRATRTSAQMKRYTWSGRDAREVVLLGTVEGREQPLLRFDGTWALFEMFQRASWRAVGRDYALVWRIQSPNVVVEADLQLGDTEPILRGGYFGNVSCARRIVR